MRWIFLKIVRRVLRKKLKDNITAKRTYKDSVFTDLFSTKENLFDLYRTLHPDDTGIMVDDIKDVKLDNTLFTNMYNDLAFKVGNRLIILMEHQSTLNYNMPLRMLFYVADEYKKIIEEFTKAIYKEKLIHLPAPEFYVVYTGKKTHPDVLELADALGKSESLNLKVSVITEEDASNLLGGYITFIKKIEEFRDNNDIGDAIVKAINYCIENDILAKYLVNKQKEVANMLKQEWDFELEKEVLREEEREEGIITLVETVVELGKTQKEAIEIAAKRYHISAEEVADIVS